MAKSINKEDNPIDAVPIPDILNVKGDFFDVDVHLSFEGTDTPAAPALTPDIRIVPKGMVVIKHNSGQDLLRVADVDTLWIGVYPDLEKVYNEGQEYDHNTVGIQDGQRKPSSNAGDSCASC